MDIEKCYIDEWLFFDSNRTNELESPTFVEIGSFTGNHAKGLKEKYKKSKMIIYEASVKNFNELKNNVSNYDITIHNKGIGDKKEVKTFYEFKSPSSNSVFSRKNREITNSTEVEFITIFDLLDDNNIDYIDVLFMNCEGSELYILDYILENEEIQSKIKQISISFHPQIYGEQKIKEMKTKINENGYLSYTNNRKWPCTLIIKK